jgi:putative Ca2+/H+ antiporter (TMEM165/GDT1 family)
MKEEGRDRTQVSSSILTCSGQSEWAVYKGAAIATIQHQEYLSQDLFGK